MPWYRDPVKEQLLNMLIEHAYWTGMDDGMSTIQMTKTYLIEPLQSTIIALQIINQQMACAKSIKRRRELANLSTYISTGVLPVDNAAR